MKNKIKEYFKMHLTIEDIEQYIRAIETQIDEEWQTVIDSALDPSVRRFLERNETDYRHDRRVRMYSDSLGYGIGRYEKVQPSSIAHHAKQKFSYFAYRITDMSTKNQTKYKVPYNKYCHHVDHEYKAAFEAFGIEYKISYKYADLENCIIVPDNSHSRNMLKAIVSLKMEVNQR